MSPDLAALWVGHEQEAAELEADREAELRVLVLEGEDDGGDDTPPPAGAVLPLPWSSGFEWEEGEAA